jgi:hypothetical protein
MGSDKVGDEGQLLELALGLIAVEPEAVLTDHLAQQGRRKGESRGVERLALGGKAQAVERAKCERCTLS